MYNIYIDIQSGLLNAVQIHGANGAGSSTNDGTYTLYYQERDVQVFTPTEIVCTGINCSDWLYPDGSISEGLFYARQGELNGRGGYCMVNYLGDIQFYFEQEPLNNPSFHSGKAALIMKGAGGIVYTTLVDVSGNWLFEPVQGYGAEYCAAVDMYVISDNDKKYFLDENGNKIAYPIENVEFWIADGQNIRYAYLIDGELHIGDL